jgi:hypothetical protein
MASAATDPTSDATVATTTAAAEGCLCRGAKSTFAHDNARPGTVDSKFMKHSLSGSVPCRQW